MVAEEEGRESLFGPDSRMVRLSMVSAAADWLQADLSNPERLFVMGVLLHFNGDERAQELFSAALPISGNAFYIAAFIPEGQAKGVLAPLQRDANNALRLPPAPATNDAPPTPGLIDEPTAPPKNPPTNAAPVLPRNDGPLLLPPSPK